MLFRVGTFVVRIEMFNWKSHRFKNNKIIKFPKGEKSQ